MPWVRLDEQFPDHPKVAIAGPLASWLHVCALAYCNRLLTDGFVPTSQVGKLADYSEIDPGEGYPINPIDLANRLVEVGMWEKATGGYLIHDFHDFQPSKAEVLATRRTREAAGKAGGLASARARAQAKANDEASKPSSKSLEDRFNGVGNEASTKSNPVPSRPVPKSKASSPDGSDALSLDAAFDVFWLAYPPRDGKRVGRAKAEGYWRRLNPSEQVAAMVGARHLASAIAAGGKFGPPDAERWLRDRKWPDWQEPAHVANGKPSLDHLPEWQRR